MEGGGTDWLARAAECTTVLRNLVVVGGASVGVWVWLRRRRPSGRLMAAFFGGVLGLCVGAVLRWGWRGAWWVVAAGVGSSLAAATLSDGRWLTLLRDSAGRGAAVASDWYASAIVGLARPVRGEVAARLWNAVSEAEGGMGAELKMAVEGMPRVPFHTLWGILEAYDPTEGGRVLVRVEEIPYYAGWDSPREAWKQALSGCDNLIGRKLLSQRRGWSDGEGYCVEVHLGRLVPREKVEELREWAEEEGESRWWH